MVDSVCETSTQRRKRKDHERYILNREERLRYQREYYAKNREACIERIRMSEYKRFIKSIKKQG